MNPLKELLELAQEKEDLEERMLFKVAAARAEKHSWQAIANVIGGTKQAVQQRYGKTIERDQLLEQGKYECSCGWTIVYPGWESREALEDISDHERMHEDDADDAPEVLHWACDVCTWTIAYAPENKARGLDTIAEHVKTHTDEDYLKVNTAQAKAEAIHGERTVSVFQQFAADRKAAATARKQAQREADAEMGREILANIAAKKQADADQLAPEASKIVDAPAPAPRKKRTPGTAPKPEPMPEYKNLHGWDDDSNPWKQDDPAHFLQSKTKRPARCTYCGGTTHRLPNGGTWIYAGCTPTVTDPIYTKS